MFEAEPSIWFLIIVNKTWAGPGCSNTSLSSSLGALHTLFVLLHRPISDIVIQVCFSMLSMSMYQSMFRNHFGVCPVLGNHTNPAWALSL